MLHLERHEPLRLLLRSLILGLPVPAGAVFFRVSDERLTPAEQNVTLGELQSFVEPMSTSGSGPGRASVVEAALLGHAAAECPSSTDGRLAAAVSAAFAFLTR